MTAPIRALRGRLLSFTDDPAAAGARACTYIEDGLLLVGAGRILAVGEAGALLPQLAPAVPVDHYADALILPGRSEEHTSELQSLMRISYAVFCLKKKNHL